MLIKPQVRPNFAGKQPRVFIDRIVDPCKEMEQYKVGKKIPKKL